MNFNDLYLLSNCTDKSLLMCSNNQGKLEPFTNKYLPLNYLKDIDIYPWPKRGQILAFNKEKKVWKNENPPFIYHQPSGNNNSVQVNNGIIEGTTVRFEDNTLQLNKDDTVKNNDTTIRNGIIHVSTLSIKPKHKLYQQESFKKLIQLSSLNGIIQTHQVTIYSLKSSFFLTTTKLKTNTLIAWIHNYCPNNKEIKHGIPNLNTFKKNETSYYIVISNLSRKYPINGSFEIAFHFV